MIVEGGKTPAERIAYAFRRAVSRAPSEKELSVLVSGLSKHIENYKSDPQAAKNLLAFGDFKNDPKLSPEELAAYSMTASVILNLDETITKE